MDTINVIKTIVNIHTENYDDDDDYGDYSSVLVAHYIDRLNVVDIDDDYEEPLSLKYYYYYCQPIRSL